MITLVVVVFLTVFISANCSLYEATLYSTRTVTLEAERERGDRRKLAERFISLKRNISAPIAAILILNTISNTGGATVAGMYAGEELGPAMIPAFSVFFTLAILFFAEIMPKTLGAVYWRKAWPWIVRPLTFINYALYPAVVIAQRFANLLTPRRKAPAVTEEEVLAMVRLGAQEGEIKASESRLVHNIIMLENKQIREIMTPRTVVFSLEADMPAGEALKAAETCGFTRIPIYDDDRENLIGYIIRHELFSSKTIASPHIPIRSIAKPISFVPQSTDALALLNAAVRQHKHIFVVVDEYGGMAGLVTMEDLIETVLGDEIVDETDTVVDLQESARQRGRRLPGETLEDR